MWAGVNGVGVRAIEIFEQKSKCDSHFNGLYDERCVINQLSRGARLAELTSMGRWNYTEVLFFELLIIPRLLWMFLKIRYIIKVIKHHLGIHWKNCFDVLIELIGGI